MISYYYENVAVHAIFWISWANGCRPKLGILGAKNFPGFLPQEVKHCNKI